MTLATPGIVQSVRTAPTPSVEDNQAPNQEQLRIFSGIITSQPGGMFFFQDDSSKMPYGLDDQVLAAKFVDKKVMVTGALDKTGIIHVKNIEEKKA
jgi:uncharacterized protein YdeI (BOF family)